MNQTIIDVLDVLHRMEKQNKGAGVFKARAYAKVISAIKAHDAPIRTMDDVDAICGIGAGIRKKIDEVIHNGHLDAVDAINENGTVKAIDEYLSIYGVGPAKAKQLVDGGVKGIATLRAAVNSKTVTLNEKQTIGLKYYEDLLERIPREEVADHERILKAAFAGYECSVVGSYRRGASESGDIDLLVNADSNNPGVLKALCEAGYIVETLADGPKKYMGIVKAPGRNSVARRLDILFTPNSQYAYAILYFTGSDKFNIDMRKHALTMGWSLNEHQLSYVGTDVPPPQQPIIKSEEDIFTFLGLQWTPPTERSVYPKTLFPSVYRKFL